MRRFHDDRRYEKLEQVVARALVAGIHDDLSSSGLEGEALHKAVSSVAFSVACLYDGSTHVDAGDDYLVPILGFAMGRMRDRLLIPSEGGSGVHEFIPGVVSELFPEHPTS